jgi:hypothetical protein
MSKPVCRALTSAGKPCKAKPVPGTDLCRSHSHFKPLVEAELVSTVSSAAEGEWRAAAWLLERRWPERWRRAGGLEAAVEDGPDGLDELTARRAARRQS